MSLFSKPDSPDLLVLEIRRLNDNFERYLNHLRVPQAPASDIAAYARLFIGEPVSELEMAIQEHAKLTGQELTDADQ